MSAKTTRDTSLQALIFALQEFWSAQGCVILQPYDMEMGAGTFHPATMLRALGKQAWRAAYVQPSRRPSDGRYGNHPNRFGHYYQFQTILKPSPPDMQELYLQSLQTALGIDPNAHDIRFVEDDWESPTLGAWGLGWEVWCDGLEISQFTYFQQVGGLECNPVSGELTYGLERLAMFIQAKRNGFDLQYGGGKTYGDVFQRQERELSAYSFEAANVEMLLRHFQDYAQECEALIKARLPQVAYDFCMKASHCFNVLDARGVLGVAERENYIGQVRALAQACAEAYVAEQD